MFEFQLRDKVEFILRGYYNVFLFSVFKIGYDQSVPGEGGRVAGHGAGLAGGDHVIGDNFFGENSASHREGLVPHNVIGKQVGGKQEEEKHQPEHNGRKEHSGIAQGSGVDGIAGKDGENRNA